jgi:predicted site-specific integrase-resolvase
MTDTPETPAGVPPAQDEILTHREAAAFLKVHPDSLTRWVNEGVVPKPGKVGGRLRYLKSTLIELVRQSEAG